MEKENSLLLYVWAMLFLISQEAARKKVSSRLRSKIGCRMNNYEVIPITQQDTNDIMKLLRRTFFIDEPMNKALDLCKDNSCTELEEYCTHSLLEGLTFKAVDKDANIVGVIISGVIPLKSNAKEVMLKEARDCQNPKFQKILYVLAQREDARLWEKFPEDEKFVEIKVAATDPAWRRKGIMIALVAKTEEAVKNLNIRLLRMDCSSAYSAMSAEKLGFTCMYSAKYTDIQKDGVPLVVPEHPHVNDRVYVKTLWDK